MKQTILQGRPDARSGCNNEITEFFNHRDELSVSGDLIFRGQKLVIPKALRQHTIKQVLTEHMDVDKSLQRAKDVMFWSGMF